MNSGRGLQRRSFLVGLPALVSGLGAARAAARAEPRRFRIALANFDETPGVTLEGLGFTGADVRSSFELAARTRPVDMLYFDNAGDPTRAIAEAAIRDKVDLLIEYTADGKANAKTAHSHGGTGILAVGCMVPEPGASP